MTMTKLSTSVGIVVFSVTLGIGSSAAQVVPKPTTAQRCAIIAVAKPACGGASSSCVRNARCGGQAICTKWKCDFKLG